MNIYFHEVSVENYNRYVNPIIKALLDKNDNMDLKLFYIIDSIDRNAIQIEPSIEKALTIIDSNQVKNVVKKNIPDAFICFAFRIPDIYWTLFFKKMKVVTFQVQHGLYIEFFSRSSSGLIKELPKILNYLFLLIRVLLNSRFIYSTFKAIIKKDVKAIKNINQVDSNIKSDHILVWGEYWIDWFKTSLFYDNNSKFHICGSFDTQILDKKEQVIISNTFSVTYICQTLIEDRRLDRRQFNLFKKNLMSFAKTLDGQLFIKLHPRSWKSLYIEFESLDNVTITNKFPISDHYIGHYSTMLFLSNNLLKPLTIIEFDGHPTPHFLKEIAGTIIDSNERIALDNSKQINSKKASYYSKKENNPFNNIANVILNETQLEA